MTDDKRYPDPPVALRHSYKFTDPFSGESIWRPLPHLWNGQAAQESIGLYTLAQMREYADATCALRDEQSTSAMFGKVRVGDLATLNQDPYQELGEWWVQLRIGTEGDEVLARVYGPTLRETYERANVIAKAINAVKTIKEQ